MINNQLEILLNRAEKLVEKTAGLSENDHAQLLTIRVREAINFCRQQNPQKPLVISLIGGTGVGKSYIFSRLSGTPGLSPSSDSVRGFTRKPVIAANETAQAFLPFTAEEADLVPALIDDAVLIDTPDLDSINQENRALSHKTIASSDIIVCVTSPDKRSDFSVQQQVLQWASRKRWFFVMNRADLAADVPLQSLRQDYVQRLRALGFQPDNDALFIFSAKEKNSQEFARFSQSLFSLHPASLSLNLYQEACLRQLLHPFTDLQTIAALQKLRVELTNFKETLTTRLLAEEHNILTGDSLISAWQRELQSRIYQYLETRTTAFLYPLIALTGFFRHNNANNNTQFFLAEKFFENQSIRTCFSDERRFLQDKRLTSEETPADIAKYCQRRATIIYNRTIETSLELFSSKNLSFYLLLGNLLPLIIFSQALYRSIFSWTAGTWLPSDFFIHAAALIIAAILPGCLLLARGIANISQKIRIKDIESADGAFILIEKTASMIDTILQQSSEFCVDCKSQLVLAEKSLPSSVCGISQQKEPDAPFLTSAVENKPRQLQAGEAQDLQKNPES